MILRRRRGQMIIMAALVMALMIFSVAISVYSAATQYQQLQYDQAREVISNFRVDFGHALVDILSTLTQRYNVTAEMDTPRFQAYYDFSFWTRAATRSFASQGIQLSFNTTQSTPLQPAGTYYGYSADARSVYNLTKLFWYTPQAISAIYAGFNANLTALGVYNWTENAEFLLNVTLDAGVDFTGQTRGLGNAAPTLLNVTVGRENSQAVEDLNASNFQVDYYDKGLNMWTSASVVAYNTGGGTYTLALYTYDGKTIIDPYWKYLMIWVQDTRGILVESYTYTHVDYTIQENALLAYAAPKPDETYDFEMLNNGSVMWYNTILNMTSSTLTAPSGVVSYAPLSLNNSQTTAIAGGSQVMLNMNWANYAAYLDNPVDNYVFFDGSGAALNSWLENGTANTSTNSAVWLKLNATGIPASSISSIYLGFYPAGTNVLGVNNFTGEGPGLTGTYGQYDNGIRVFTNYWNFSGSSLPSPFVGSGASATPSGVVNYVPITLTNAQNTAASGGSQVMVTVNWNNYASYLDNPVDNYVFFNSAGTPLNSWLESGTANSGNGVVWVKLDSSGIPANGAVTINLGFYPKTTNVLGWNNATGASAQLAAAYGVNYGKYDNGNLTFSFYDNFNGTTLSSIWTQGLNAPTSKTVNNGLDVVSASESLLYAATPAIANGIVMEILVKPISGGYWKFGLGQGLTAASLFNSISGYLIRPNWGASSTFQIMRFPGFVNLVSPVDVIPLGGTYKFQLTWSTTAANNIIGTDVTTGATGSATDKTFPPSTGTQVALDSNGEDLYSWVRTRSALPNNVMPTASFGSISAAGSAAFTVNNGLSLTSGAIYTGSAQFSSLNNVLEANMSWTGAPGFLTGLTQANASSVQSGNAGGTSLISCLVPGTVALAAYAADGTLASFNLQNNVGTGFSETQGTYYIVGSFVNSSKVGELHDYITDATAAGTFSKQEFIWVGSQLGSAAGGTADTPMSVQWIRVRTYLPNGVNPTASFGSVSSITSSVTIIPIPLPPVKQFRVNATVTGPSDAADLNSNTVPSQVEVWNPDLVTPSQQFANWQLRFNSSEKLVFELNYAAANIHQQTARIYWLSDGDAAIPSPLVNITINGNFTDITNGVYTLRMVANGGYSIAIDWSMSMIYGGNHVEYTLTGVGWSPFNGGAWLPDILPYGAWTIIAGPIRAVAYRSTAGVWGSLNNTGSANGPWFHNDTILIPYNTKYWQLYEAVNWTMNYVDNAYYDFLTMISGTSSSTGVANWAYQQVGGTVRSGVYSGSPTGFTYYTDYNYWFSQYQANFGEAVLPSTAYVNSLTNMFAGNHHAITPWTSADFDRHVLDDMAYEYANPGTITVPVNTLEQWTAGIWAFDGFSGNNWTTYSPNIYYKMFVEQFYPTVVAITGGF